MPATRAAAIAGIAAAIATGSLPRRASAQAGLTNVSIGVVGSTSESPLFIADKLGYFREVGIVPAYVTADSAANMIAPLGTGQLDVATGGPSAGLYNAIGRGVDIKIVADKGSTPKGYGYMMLLMRKQLVDSGRYKSARDLKGMRVSESGAGTIASPAIARYLATAGLKYSDIEHVYLSFPQQVAAMSSGAIDAALTVEPIASNAIRQGIAVRAAGDDVMYPNQQLAVILYGGAFIKKAELGDRFMRAYIRGCRYYNDALRNGKLDGPNAETVIAIMTQFSSIKDPAIIAAMTPNGNDPNGRLNVASLASDLQFFKDQGLIESPVTIEQSIDTSFVDSAVKALPPYHRHT
jgi:NitT/TauT family transport system substrate-binding protein